MIMGEKGVELYLCPRCLLPGEEAGACPQCGTVRLTCRPGDPDDPCPRPRIDAAGRRRAEHLELAFDVPLAALRFADGIHLVLAARNEDLGTCWIGALHDKEIKKIVNAPDNVDVVMVIPLGYPASSSAFRETSSRKPLSDICFNEQYGR